MTQQFTPRDRMIADLAPQGIRRVDFVVMAEPARVAAIKAAAVPLAACGPAVQAAPARGPVVITNPIGLIPSGEDGWKAERVAYRGRSVQVIGDVFDVMNARARAAGGADPFTPGQISMARHYRALVEGRAAGGIKCQSLDGSAGGGSARDRMDHYIADGVTLQRMVARIGHGAALVVRRVRPSMRAGVARAGGAKAGVILDRVVVDSVCLYEMRISQVLRAAGWAVKGEYRAALRVALAGALDRMQGYGGG